MSRGYPGWGEIVTTGHQMLRKFNISGNHFVNPAVSGNSGNEIEPCTELLVPIKARYDDTVTKSFGSLR